MPGRPTKLTPRIREALVEAVEGGNFVETACEALNIHPATFYRWLNDPRHSDLRDAIARARAHAEEVAIAHIRTAAREDWRAAAWYLERTRPDRFAPPKRAVELSGTPEAPLYLAPAPSIKADVLPPEAVRALLAALPEGEETIVIEVEGQIVEDAE